MELNVNDINLSQLDLGGNGIAIIDLVIKPSLKSGQEITDMMYSWIVNAPPISASAEENVEERQREEYKRYLARQESSLTLVRAIKKEFYDFFCTESEYYQKERASIGGNVNHLITGISAAIATKVANVEVGIVTSFVTCFLIVLAKIGKKSMCEFCKPKSE